MLGQGGAECQSPKSHSVGAHLGTPPVAYPPSFMRLSWSRDPSAQGDRHFFTGTFYWIICVILSAELTATVL